MPTSAVQVAKRAFVRVLLQLAQSYGAVLHVTRESSDKQLDAAFRKLAVQVHPDKGGTAADFQSLNNAREAWKHAAGKAPGTRPANQPDQQPAAPQPAQSPPPAAEPASALSLLQQFFPGLNAVFRVNSLGVLLSYLNFPGVAEWTAFCQWVQSRLVTWKAKLWCATLETCKSGKYHVHLMLQFASAAEKPLKLFWYKGLKPNASTNDLCGDGQCRKKLQQSLDRGFFYTYASKIGTVKDSKGEDCTSGNYWPAWCDERVTYQVLGKWPETLFKQYKIAFDVYDDLLHKCRDGVPARMRNLEACRQWEESKAAKAEIEARVKRIRGNPELFQPFPEVPEAQEWLQLFQKDAIRYPFLMVLAPSHSGKTEWANSLFKKPLEAKVGDLEFFPDRLRQFKRGLNDCLVLDDVCDLRWLVRHQDKLQGKYNGELEFGSTQGGTCHYDLDLYAVPIVVTANYSTKSLELLETDDFLGKPENRVLVHFKGFPRPSQPASSSEELVFLWACKKSARRVQGSKAKGCKGKTPGKLPAHTHTYTVKHTPLVLAARLKNVLYVQISLWGVVLVCRFPSLRFACKLKFHVGSSSAQRQAKTGSSVLAIAFSILVLLRRVSLDFLSHQNLQESMRGA